MPESNRDFSDLTLAGALAAAEQGEIAGWVQRFLLGVGDNEPFARGLEKMSAVYLGPVEFRLELLEQICGPDPHYFLYFHPAEGPDGWEAVVERMARSYRVGWQPPPLICSQDLEVNDGNHRREMLLSQGVDSYWTIFYFDSVEQREDFSRRHWPRSARLVE